jgi:hypothetical protein
MQNEKIDTAKHIAEKLRNRLKLMGIPLKNTQALEAVSFLANSSDWNRLRAQLSRSGNSSGGFTPKESKILLGVPGIGKTSTLLEIFEIEMNVGNRVPVMICSAGTELKSTFKSALGKGAQIMFLSKEPSGDGLVYKGNIDAGAKGIIVGLDSRSIGDLRSMKSAGLLVHFVDEMDSLVPIQVLERLGTLMIDEMTAIETGDFASDSKLYESLGASFSSLMSKKHLERIILSSQLEVDNRCFELLGFPMKKLYIQKWHQIFGGKTSGYYECLSEKTPIFRCESREVENVFMRLAHKR